MNHNILWLIIYILACKRLQNGNRKATWLSNFNIIAIFYSQSSGLRCNRLLANTVCPPLGEIRELYSARCQFTGGPKQNGSLQVLSGLWFSSANLSKRRRTEQHRLHRFVDKVKWSCEKKILSQRRRPSWYFFHVLFLFTRIYNFSRLC